MSLTRIAVSTALATLVFVSAGHPQSLRNAQTPAEFPPASFKGTQYVDSNGCVFIRAGIDGNVTWVPRVNRQRQLICGQTPSLSATAAATARAAPSEATAGTPEQITIAPPAPEVAESAPQAVRRPTQQAQAPRTVTRQPVVAAPVAPATPTQTAAAQQTAPACPGGTTVSTRFINSGQGGAVRCGPQTAVQSAPVAQQPVAPATTVATAAAPASDIATPQTRMVPRHVFENRALKRPARVPEGYVPVWEDDRLNPRRAEQTLNGIAQTRLAWTRTVPRRLIDRSTGRDVTATVPLVFPYTDVDTQERNLGRVTLIRQNGQTIKRVQRKSRAKARQPSNATPSAGQTKDVLATRAQPTAPQQGRYVQVGTYGVPSNAQAAAQRIARAGLPARIGKLKRGNKSYQVVLAGPFTSSSELSSGLQRSRAVGFSDAFIRK